MIKSYLLRYRVFLLHLSFWVLYSSYRWYDIQAYLGYRNALIYVSIPLSFNLLASYTHYFVILPAFIRTKRAGPYALKVISLLVPVVALRIVVTNQVFGVLLPGEMFYQTITLSRVVSTLWDTLAFLIFTGMIRFTLDWFDLENKKRSLENEKLIAELNYLKAQINPHFLFNTLHNLNYLVYAGSSRATEVIIKLSNIMRYMIYDANKEKVWLKKELDYMNDYIHLESIRLNQSFKIQIACTGEIEAVEIAPLIMLTFLENSFKHGVRDEEPDCWIDMRIHVEPDLIQYQISNKKINALADANTRSGFGLANVVKRLQLSYPEKHKLDIRDDADVYHVSLTLSRL